MSQERLRLALILAVPMALYATSTGYPFQYDDIHSIVENGSIRSLSLIPSYFVDPGAFSGDPAIAMYRPLLLATYAVNYALSGYETWSYHLVNGALHATCALLVYLLGRAVGLAARWAGCAALLFAVHPVNTECVNYISSRSELLAGCIILGALLAHIRRPRTVTLAVLYGLGLAAKSVAIVLPALCVGYDLLVRRDQLRQRLPAYGAMVVVTGIYMAGVGHFLKTATLDSPVRTFAEQIWSQIKALVLYAQLLVVPRGLSVDHQFQISDSFADPFAAGATLVVVSGLALVARQAVRRPILVFLFFLWLISLAPSSLVPLNVLVNEHRLYLPSAAFALLMGLCFQGISAPAREAGWWRSPHTAAVALASALALLAAQRSQVWASEYSLWESAARQGPLMARPQIMLAEAHARDGRPGLAREYMSEGLERDPGYAAGYQFLARLERDAGRLEAARDWLRRGLAANPREAALWGTLGSTLVEMAQARGSDGDMASYGEAHRAFARAVELAADEPSHRNNLGNTLQVLGRPAQSLEHHRIALQLQPGDPQTLVNLGNAHQMMGHLDSAEASYRSAVVGDATFAGAWVNLASVLDRQSRHAAALSAYERAARLDSSYEYLLRSRRVHRGGDGP